MTGKSCSTARGLPGKLTISVRSAMPATPRARMPSGASALAALLHGKVEAGGRRTGVVLSGGNVDVSRFCELTG